MSELPEPRQQKTPGAGMMVAGFVLALMILTWLMAGYEKQQYNPNQRPLTNMATSGNGNDYLEVILKRNRWNQYLASGYVNGIEVEFLIDTGATTISIPAGLEQVLGLKRGVVGYAQTANGTARTYSTVLRQVDLAGIKREDIRASIVENMDTDFILLGMNYLATVEMVQSYDTLVLRERI